MGRYEDLLAAAKSGDASAFDALETEFSGTALRTKAEEADSAKAWREQNIGLVRKAKFDEFFSTLDDSLKASGLTAEAFGDFDPDTLTPDVVKMKAQDFVTRQGEARLAVAKDAGFETVEEFNKAIADAKAAKATQRQALEAVGRSAATGSGGAGEPGESEMYQAAVKDFEAAKSQGQTDDRALGEFVHTLLAQQSPLSKE